MTRLNPALSRLERELMDEYNVAPDAEARQEVLRTLDEVQREIYGDEAVDEWAGSGL